MRLAAEFLGTLFLVPATGYGIYCLILRILNRPKVIVVTRPSDNQSS